MNFIFLALIGCFFFFLYILYYLSKDDFVIVRKDIALERIFNLAILTGLFSLFFSRLFYAIFNPSQKFLSPLIFFAFPYFPGLSLIGGIIGAALFIYMYGSFRRMPVGRIFDLFTMSFIGILPVGFLFVFILLLGQTSLFFNIMFVASLFFLVIFSKVIFLFASRGEIKDGSFGLIYIISFSFLYFLTKLLLTLNTFSFVDLENITLLTTFFGALIILLNQEIMDKFLNRK